MKSINKTYKIQLPHNKEAQNIRTNIKDGTIEVEVELKEKWEPRVGEICYACTYGKKWQFVLIYGDTEWPSVYNNINFKRWELRITNSHWSYDSIRPATDFEKQLLLDALAKKGKMWDAHKKAVVDYLPRWRAEKDCRYYYIKNCDATIHSGDDNRFEVDNNLYESGNYFKTKEAAERVAEQIREIFKNSKAE